MYWLRPRPRLHDRLVRADGYGLVRLALVVALHFLPLAALLQDWSLAIAGLIQTVGLGVLWKRLSADDGVPTSQWADPWMGVTRLRFALVSAGGVRRQGRRTLVILRPTWG